MRLLCWLWAKGGNRQFVSSGTVFRAGLVELLFFMPDGSYLHDANSRGGYWPRCTNHERTYARSALGWFCMEHLLLWRFLASELWHIV